MYINITNACPVIKVILFPFLQRILTPISLTSQITFAILTPRNNVLFKALALKTARLMPSRVAAADQQTSFKEFL
jgi:hypothetical protein